MVSHDADQPVQSNVTKTQLPLRRSARQQEKKKKGGHDTSHEDERTPFRASPEQIPASNSPDASVTTSRTLSTIPAELPQKLPGLTQQGRKLLHYKQGLLKSRCAQSHGLENHVQSSSALYETLKTAVDATLVFAQEEAGTAVCISENGLLLTCSHCVAEEEEELDFDKIWWLIFASGDIVKARTIKWDPRRDLALLQIIGAQTVSSKVDHAECPAAFPFLTLSSEPPRGRAPLLCIGHPGSEDLEIGRPGVTTGYDVLHVSDGKFCGIAKGQDVQDNSEIGALMHDCWTYWGHSGAPLVETKQGVLIGLHSSWDDQTAMRRGVAWEAIKAFRQEYENDASMNEG